MTDISSSYFMNVAPEPASGIGMCRLVAQLDGENVLRLDPYIGFSHRGIEKMMESQNILQALVYADKLCRIYPYTGAYAFVLAAEKLCGVQVPDRAQKIRSLLAEISRISAHLTSVGNLARDTGIRSVGAVVAKACRRMNALCEEITQSPASTYFRVGGVARDFVDGFEHKIERWADNEIEPVLAEVRTLIDNRIFQLRTKGVGFIDEETAINAGFTGVNARASGVKRDIRVAETYDAYKLTSFDVPLSKGGDCYARFEMRFAEAYQSVTIIRQLLHQLVDGKINAFEITDTSTLTGMSEHFKIFAQGFPLAKGDVYEAIESPFGEMGVFLVGDGTPLPYRCHFRSAGFPALQALSGITKGLDLVDIRTVVSSLGILMTEIDR